MDSMPNKVVKVTEQLSCKLNEVEWQNRARELAEANQAVASKEEVKKNVTKELTAEVSKAKAEAARLTSVVSSHHELREVTVEVIYDYDKGTVTRRRTDTGEVLGERQISDQERQAELDFHDANEVIEDTRAAEREEEELGEDGEADQGDGPDDDDIDTSDLDEEDSEEDAGTKQ